MAADTGRESPSQLAQQPDGEKHNEAAKPFLSLQSLQVSTLSLSIPWPVRAGVMVTLLTRDKLRSRGIDRVQIRFRSRLRPVTEGWTYSVVGLTCITELSSREICVSSTRQGSERRKGHLSRGCARPWNCSEASQHSSTCVKRPGSEKTSTLGEENVPG